MLRNKANNPGVVFAPESFSLVRRGIRWVAQEQVLVLPNELFRSRNYFEHGIAQGPRPRQHHGLKVQSPKSTQHFLNTADVAQHLSKAAFQALLECLPSTRVKYAIDRLGRRNHQAIGTDQTVHEVVDSYRRIAHHRISQLKTQFALVRSSTAAPLNQAVGLRDPNRHVVPKGEIRFSRINFNLNHG
jgi:hypothetical protein